MARRQKPAIVVDPLVGPGEPGCPGMTIEKYEAYIAQQERMLCMVRQELAELRRRAHGIEEVN
jgi:hypothetical protein